MKHEQNIHSSSGVASPKKRFCPKNGDSSKWMDFILMGVSGSSPLWASYRFSHCNACLPISVYSGFVQYVLLSVNPPSQETCQTHQTSAMKISRSASRTGYLFGRLSVRLSIIWSGAAGNAVWWCAFSANRHLVASKLTNSAFWQMIYRWKRLWTHWHMFMTDKLHW